MVDSDDFLIREVKAELERERMQSLWQRYGTYLLGGAALIIASVGGYQYWQASQLAANQKAGAEYDQALNLVLDKKYDEASEKFKAVADSGSEGYSVLSQLQLAATLLDQDKPDEAAQVFEKVTKSGGDKVFTDFAQLQLSALKLGTADFTETENRLNGLISDQNPWRFNARELLGLAHLRAGRTEEARKSFELLLGDRAVPAALQNRVQVLLAQIIAADVKSEAEAKTPVADENTAENAAKEGDGPAAASASEGKDASQAKAAKAVDEKPEPAKTDAEQGQKTE